MKLNVHTVRDARFPESARNDIVLLDDEVTGFGLRIYPSGKKAFVVMYRFRGRLRRITLGDYPVFTVDQARALAREKLAAVAHGIDPAEKPEAVRRTMNELLDDYLARWAEPRKKTVYEDRRRIEKHIRPRWGALAVVDIRRLDVQKFYEDIGRAGKIEANRVLSLLSKIFDLAERWGYIPEDSPNPARRIERFKEHRRDRWITPEELPRLIEAIEAEPDIRIRAGIWLYLLTGLRHRELIRRRWADLDIDRRVLRLNDTKAGRPFYLPLSDFAVEIFQSLPRVEGNPWMFPSETAESGHWWCFPRRAWTRIREHAGMPDLTIHALRHTLASWMAAGGESMKIIGAALNQSTAAITERYTHLSDDPLRRAFESVEEKIIEIARLRREKASV